MPTVSSADTRTSFDGFVGDFGLVRIDRSKLFPGLGETGPQVVWPLRIPRRTMYLKIQRAYAFSFDLWERLDAPMDSPLSQCTLIKAIEQSEKEGLKVVNPA
jgi:hypothetical protein